MKLNMLLTTSLYAAAATFAVAAAPASAATVVTSAAVFALATTSPGVDTFAGFSITGTTSSPITRTAGTYSYTAAAANNFYGAGTTANPWLSTNIATDAMVFTGFASNVRGVGGLFFGSDISGAYQLGNIVLTLVDSSGTTSYTVTNATTSSFVGFVSTGAITSLTVSAVQPSATTFLWPTLDNLRLAQGNVVSVVPEPATWALMLAGFGMVGFSLRRRSKVSTKVTYA